MSYIDELKDLSEDDLHSWVEAKIYDTVHDLCNDETVASEIAGTNATGWGVDEFEILDVKLKTDHVTVRISYELTGDQDEDKGWFGTEIRGEALVIIDAEGDVKCTNVTAERDLGEDVDLVVEEDIYRADPPPPLIITNIGEEVKRYFARYPEKLYNLTSRQFEELIAEILTDLGFKTELTAATRDGGRDIYAYVTNAVTSFLMFVECKKWAADRKVGIDIVQRLHGAADVGGAHKAMIVTTSFFTQPAQQERDRIASRMELKDYNALKEWLTR